MAQKRLSVRKTREILRLAIGEGKSLRDVGCSVGVSPSVVHDCLGRFKATDLRWPVDDLDDTELEARMYNANGNTREQKAIPDWKDVHVELRRKHVTKHLLWQEYKLIHPEDGYQYSRFCELYQLWRKPLDVVMRQEHKAGDKVFVDWSGDGIDITDPESGEVKEASLFVAVLGASGYTFCMIAPTRQLRHWIECHIKMYEFFGGVPEATVPDNEKTGVTSPCLYEPDLNPTYLDLAEHYDTAVIPTRPRKPRDKAKVENAVLNVQRWILARLRNHKFFNVAQANAEVSKLLKDCNNRLYQKLDVSRKELFDKLDRPVLRPLPARRYEYATWSKPKVNIDYHVSVDKHHYSVPYKLVGERTTARITSSMVEILHNGRRVATHRRSFAKWGTTTNPEHMPRSHREQLKWTPSRIINWAFKVGPKTAELVERIMASKRHPEQGYKSCLGVMRLAKKYSPERLEGACRRSLFLRSPSYKTVKSILVNNLDGEPLPAVEQPELALPFHDNIRGPEYYH